MNWIGELIFSNEGETWTAQGSPTDRSSSDFQEKERKVDITAGYTLLDQPQDTSALQAQGGKSL